MKTFISLLKRYRHGWIIVVYGLIHSLWFSWLQSKGPTNHTMIRMSIDDHIPFLEVFAIPYYLWFAFVAAAWTFFLIKDAKEYYRLTAYMIAGMVVCLTIYTVWPNGQALRPTEFIRENLLTDMMRFMYRVDDSLNVFPSIHVFNSIAIYVAIVKSVHLKDKKWIRWGALALTVLICLSTVFVKQHSAADGLAAIVLAACLYPFFYRRKDVN